jgi:NADH-quinone oxidoreductase subunit F
VPDLHFTSATASQEERAAIDAALKEHRDDIGRHLVLPMLHALNDRTGWISPGGVNYVGERLGVAPADVYGVATFYAFFATKPRAPRVIEVCDDIACMCAGSQALCDTLEATIGPPGQSTPDGTTWLRSPCLGLCDRAPAAMIRAGGTAPAFGRLWPANAARIAQVIGGETPSGDEAPHVGGSLIQLLRRVGRIDPQSLQAYRDDGGYQGLSAALSLGPERTIAEITASNLLGRGGAAFPTGRKMDAVSRALVQPHYLICNADESEPGTFKDRVLMERDPFAIVEAMTIAAYAVGCERGFIYIRGEYPLAAQRITGAIDAARAAGLLGNDVMGAGVRFDIEIRRGAGAYICGEETALFNSIEGKRGEPRNKPPFPVEAGLFGKPTLVNNVETLANLPWILREGGAAFAKIGTPSSTGTRIFCLSGAIERPGVYEVPHGTILGDLIDLAGGIPSGRTLQAMLLGGAAGTLGGPELLSMPLTFEDARAANATLGSGVVMLYDEHVDVKAILRRIARFFRDESCGQCVPCRIGTVRQEEALERLSHAGNGAQRTLDLTLLDEIGAAMRDASICGLGQTAANAVESARKRLGCFAAETPA